ncbi:MAG: hypothetical protein H6Q68_1576 [Firmicutes bacterium]|nr:hypothetical protein [Bacillota bacterium]
MYNHTITRLAYWPIFFIMFVSGICIGSIFGLTFGLMNQASVGIFGGAFIALLTGLTSGILGLISTAVFNILAPVIGGIALEIEQLPMTSKDNINIQPPEPQSH